MNPRTAPIVAAAAALLTAAAAHAQVIGCACDGDYEVGDRVRLLVSNPGPNPGLPAGTLGTVICGRTPPGVGLDLVVRWDGWTNGNASGVNACDCPVAPGGGTTSDGTVACSAVERIVTVTNVTQGTEHSTIANSIAAALPGDVLELGPYTFHEHDLVLNGRDLTIRGQGPGVTVIDGEGRPNRLLRIESGDRSVIERLTIRGSTSASGAVQIQSAGTSATFRDCHIVDNATGTLAAVTISYASATFHRCRFEGNTGHNGTIHILMLSGDLTAIGCVFSAGSGDRAVNIYNNDRIKNNGIPANGRLINCTFATPTADTHLHAGETGTTVEVIGCVFGPGPSQGPLVASGGGAIIASRSVYQGAAGDNIGGTPTFVDAPAGDYRLAPGSLGIDAADFDAYTAAGGGWTDLEGALRLMDDPGVFDTGIGAASHLDAGAHEFQGASSAPAGCPGDINGDGYTDLTDFGIFAGDFGCVPNP